MQKEIRILVDILTKIQWEQREKRWVVLAKKNGMWTESWWKRLQKYQRQNSEQANALGRMTKEIWLHQAFAPLHSSPVAVSIYRSWLKVKV